MLCEIAGDGKWPFPLTVMLDPFGQVLPMHRKLGIGVGNCRFTPIPDFLCMGTS